ncbi:MAG: acylneuraminate cytidylyltransferase family protein [Alphaproteobacteria bacterium]|nr:acylneuraminate cytidylyltransferase family protein [Alphaproteobacteria bacterium]
MKSLGIIQARGGSKRLPRKNVKPLLGVPLIGYIVKAALASKLTKVIVSTDDEEIAALARAFGAEVPFMRPAELAADYASDEDILFHALDWMKEHRGEDYDILVKLHPTTPFVLPESIDSCLDTVMTTDAACCFTARPAADPPQWIFGLDANRHAHTLLGDQLAGDKAHSQLLDKYYFPTGAAYAIRVDAMRQQNCVFAEPVRLVEMDVLRSVDIDDDLDFALAEIVGRKLGLGGESTA